MEPTFKEGTCRFERKQCDDTKCYCVHHKTGVRTCNNAEVPLGETYNCNSKFSEKTFFWFYCVFVLPLFIVHDRAEVHALFQGRSQEGGRYFKSIEHSGWDSNPRSQS
jgi:hypothetical protein